MHSKAKMEVSILYNIKYLQCHGSLFLGVFLNKELAIRDGCHKHGLLKITDKLTFSPLIISNRYTFSS